MNIKIGDKALEVLKGMSNIHQSVILRDDYLYTKYESTVEDKTKGAENIIVNYTLPENEIELEQHLGLNNISEFLSIVNTFDKETITMSPEGTTIDIKDKRKKLKFFSGTIDALPQKEEAGEALYAEGETVIKMVLADNEIENIIKDLAIINIDTLSIVSDNGKIKICGENSSTSNTTEIDIEDKFVAKAEDNFVFPNQDIFNVIMKGIYKVEVRKCDYNGTPIWICRFENNTIGGLTYTTVLAG